MLDNLKQKAAKMTGIPKDILLNLPLITMIGNTEISIENFKGIVEYNDDIVKIKTGSGILKITGKKLLLAQITSEIINVSGVIKGIEF